MINNLILPNSGDELSQIEMQYIDGGNRSGGTSTAEMLLLVALIGVSVASIGVSVHTMGRNRAARQEQAAVTAQE
ncbi:MAG: hypothetical protein FWB72_05985 [Firmicutes bacterium]|nr:hypothetical protein [Bacillota bacterium]